MRSWFLGATMAALALTACGEAKQSVDDSFNKSFHEKFVSSCVGSASKSGVDQALATKLCQCASDKVAERYSAKEKITLGDAQLTPIVKECRAANPA